MRPSPAKLKRSLNLPLLTLYGLGTTIGAGIYALLGEIAGVAGYGAPWSFLIASSVAFFTACSFAELSGRFPKAAGAALYVQRGFNADGASLVVGLLVATTGLVSAAALLNGFFGYLNQFITLDRLYVIAAVGLVLGALAAWGILESVTVAALITLIEIGGIVAVIVVSGDNLATLPDRWTEFLPGNAQNNWGGIFIGVTLAFYAFIGFEDMVDIAEEVTDVERTLPRGILLTLVISTALYLVLMIAALLSLDPSSLSTSSAPMAALFAENTNSTASTISLIALFAIINGALIQLVMVSRVLYGLSSRGQLPNWFGRVSPLTQTPLNATGFATLVLVSLALAGHLAGLARTTSLLMLGIFGLVNISLWRIKGSAPNPPRVMNFPRLFPMIGALLSVGLITSELWKLVA